MISTSHALVVLILIIIHQEHALKIPNQVVFVHINKESLVANIYIYMSKYILPLFRDPEVKIVQTFFFKHFLPIFEQVPISIEKSKPNFTV